MSPECALPEGIRGWAVADTGGWIEVIRVGAVEIRTRWREDRLIGRCDHTHFIPDPCDLAADRVGPPPPRGSLRHPRRLIESRGGVE